MGLLGPRLKLIVFKVGAQWYGFLIPRHYLLNELRSYSGSNNLDSFIFPKNILSNPKQYKKLEKDKWHTMTSVTFGNLLH